MKAAAGLLMLSVLAFAHAAMAAPVRIVALGDSQTDGRGVSRPEAFPAQLEAMLRATGYDVQIVNAGISGDTTAGMLSRLDSAVPAGTQLVILQGGGNDQKIGRRYGMNVSPAQTMANVEKMLQRLKSRRIAVVLCGFPGQDRVGLANRYDAAFVARCVDRSNIGPDGEHMNAAGHRNIAVGLLPAVQRMLPHS